MDELVKGMMFPLTLFDHTLLRFSGHLEKGFILLLTKNKRKKSEQGEKEKPSSKVKRAGKLPYRRLP
ncbi:MAG: hypothetical protein HPY81_02880 [Firmicutes bacterium]|nr:hypothetical protein [Bacillota bacterium]